MTTPSDLAYTAPVYPTTHMETPSVPETDAPPAPEAPRRSHTKTSVKPYDAALLDEFITAAHLKCVFAEQMDEWGVETKYAIYRARKAGVSVEVLRDVLIAQGKEPASLKTIRCHLNGSCRCPKRMGR